MDLDLIIHTFVLINKSFWRTNIHIKMTTYDHSELGIASAQGNTAFLVVICIFVAVIHIVQHNQQSEKYPRALIRLTMIISAPALLSICCLFGMFWRSVLIDLFV